MRYFYLLIAVCAAPTHAFADRASATACAASLKPEARMIYDATAPKITPTADLRGEITTATTQLVQSGKVARGTARENAQSAGACLQALR